MEFIIGFQKDKPLLLENIMQFTNLQDAVSGTIHPINIGAENLDAAKIKLMAYALNDYMPLNKAA